MFVHQVQTDSGPVFVFKKAQIYTKRNLMAHGSVPPLAGYSPPTTHVGHSLVCHSPVCKNTLTLKVSLAVEKVVVLKTVVHYLV